MGQRGGRWLWRKEAAQGDKCGVGVGVSPEDRRPGNTSLRLKSARWWLARLLVLLALSLSSGFDGNSLRIRHDFYLSWASSQALASFLSTEKPMHHRLLCEVWSLILSGISPPICSNPKKHVLATGIRSLTNEPAPLQVTICQVPPPHPLSFSVPQQGAQQPEPPWVETFLPPCPHPPADRGLLSFLLIYRSRQSDSLPWESVAWVFLQRRPDERPCPDPATQADITPSFRWPFQFCGHRARRRGAARGEWETPGVSSERCSKEPGPEMSSGVLLWVAVVTCGVTLRPGFLTPMWPLAASHQERRKLRGRLLPSHCSLRSLPADRRRARSLTESPLSTSRLMMGRGPELIPGGYHYWLNGLRQETAASERFFKWWISAKKKIHILLDFQCIFIYSAFCMYYTFLSFFCDSFIGICACLCVHTLFCPNLCDPMDYRPPGSSVHGISQARILSGLPFPSPGDLPNPGIEPKSLLSPALAGGFFASWATREALIYILFPYIP